MTVAQMGAAAREAARGLARMGALQKNAVLEAMASALLASQDTILAANKSVV